MKQSRQKYVWIKRISIFIMAYVCLLSVNKLLSLVGNTHPFYGVGLFGYNIWAVAGYVILLLLGKSVCGREDKRLHVLSFIGGLCLSAAIVYGTYAHFVNDIFVDAGTVFLQFGLILGIAVATAPLTEELFLFFDRIQSWYEQKMGAGKASDSGNVKNPGIYILIFILLLFLSWIPMFLANWPGNFIYDAKYQISENLTHSYSTHHPLLHTLLMGWAYKLGQTLGNVSAGYRFYTILQMLVLSSAFAYLLVYLYRKNAPRCIRVGVLLWFALFPMHPLFAITSTKDVLFAAFFLYLMMYLVRLLFDKEKFCWHSYVGLIASGMLSMLFRNNGVYAIVVGAVLIAVLAKRWKERLLIVGLVAVMFCGYQVGNRILIASTHAGSSDTYRESMCLPLQCLARVACYHRDEMKEEDYQEICLYLREEDISSYNPYNADLVKNNANETALRSNTVNFFKLWAKVGLQFPGEYLESILTNTLGYWYPLDRGDYVVMGIPLYHTLIGTEEEIVKHSYCSPAEKIYNYFFFEGNYRQTPLLGYLFRAELYVWLLIYFILWAIYKKQITLGKIAVIPFLYLGTCFLGPTVAVRYVYCLIVLAPLFVYLIADSGLAAKKEG